ncbi:MAG: FG-GAP-like repeat-containing protein [Bacteroidota bacterium]
MSLHGLGTNSSPRCHDLTGDGILDIVIGAGRNEFNASDSAVVAINGANGEVLWTAPGTDQMVGSAVFADLNQDGNKDVIIGGRSAQLKAISGSDGAVLWDYNIIQDRDSERALMRFNFYSPQVLEDYDNDGVPDLLVSNGGNVRAFRQSGEDRYPGVIAVLSGRDGSIISSILVPDGRETYMSPLLHRSDEDDDVYVLFGTGGETFGGSLYRINMKDLLAERSEASEAIMTREGHGFVAPPTLTDINADGVGDIISNWHGGETIAFDGASYEVIWDYKVASAELNCSAAPGDVTGDGVPDFFSSYSLGKWPKNTAAVQTILDGTTGDVLFQDTIGCAGFATALSYDMNQDGYKEFIFTSNEFNCDAQHLGQVKFRMLSYDYHNSVLTELIPSSKAKNISSTPWIGDLDDNGRLDIVACVQANVSDLYTFYGILMSCMAFDIPYDEDYAGWTEYMGKNWDGVY